MNSLKKLKKWVQLLKENTLMLWFATKNPETPLLSKAICIFIVAYALSPIDLIPDFIPVVGFLDELLLLPFLIWLAIKLIPTPIILVSKTRAQEWLSQNQLNPKSKLGVLIVIVIWLLILRIAYKLI